MEDGRLAKTEKRLIVQLIPKTAWGFNLRKILTKSQWDKVRRKCYKEAGYVCEVCGKKGHKHPVECHELFEFDATNRKITLVGLIALCPECHKSCHPGRCNAQGRDVYLRARENLALVNGLTVNQAEEYYRKCFDEWRILSQVEEWSIDTSWLNSYLEDLDNG